MHSTVLFKITRCHITARRDIFNIKDLSWKILIQDYILIMLVGIETKH